MLLTTAAGTIAAQDILDWRHGHTPNVWQDKSKALKKEKSFAETKLIHMRC